MKIYKSIIFILLVTTGLYAVINQFEDSYSRIHQISSDFQTVTLPEVDVNSLLSEDHAKAGIGVPIRFGYTHEVQLSSDNSGHWEEMEDGGMLWRLGLHSPGAFAMKVHFSQFTLPKGGEFYVYSADYEMQLGPYTHQDNHESGTFGIPLLKGDHIVLEYYHPNWDCQLPQLQLDHPVANQDKDISQL